MQGLESKSPQRLGVTSSLHNLKTQSRLTQSPKPISTSRDKLIGVPMSNGKKEYVNIEKLMLENREFRKTIAELRNENIKLKDKCNALQREVS